MAFARDTRLHRLFVLFMARPFHDTATRLNPSSCSNLSHGKGWCRDSGVRVGETARMRFSVDCGGAGSDEQGWIVRWCGGCNSRRTADREEC